MKELKQCISMDVADGIGSWNETIIKLKPHIHLKMRQVASYKKKKIKDELSYGKIMMHIDYSESYKCTQQDEIQSAYSGHTCFNIFTACCYYQSGLSDGLKKVPVTITSESSDHFRITTFPGVDALVPDVH